MRFICIVGATVVRRDDLDLLLILLLAEVLPSKVSKSALARSTKVLLGLRASLEGSSGPGWAGGSAKGGLGEETLGRGCGAEERGKVMKSLNRRRGHRKECRPLLPSVEVGGHTRPGEDPVSPSGASLLGNRAVIRRQRRPP